MTSTMSFVEIRKWFLCEHQNSEISKDRCKTYDRPNNHVENFDTPTFFSNTFLHLKHSMKLKTAVL